jgi:hypothetical protein
MDDFNNLSLTRYEAVYKTELNFGLPVFTGSVIHGALGHAMRRTAFNPRRPECADCPIRSSCRHENLYGYLFESPADHPFIDVHARSIAMQQETYPQPFVIDPPAGGGYLSGESLTFSFTLIGKAIRFLPFFACSLANIDRLGGRSQNVSFESLTPMGFDLNGASEEIREELQSDAVGWEKQLDFKTFSEFVSLSKVDFGKLKLRFLTPFRFKQENKLGRGFTFTLLMKSLFRRMTLLGVHSPLSVPIDFKRLLTAAEDVQTRSELTWYDWQRYSSRQGSSMKLGGYIGTVEFCGRLNEFLPYILFGEFISVGKNCSFGLGSYRVEDLE